MRRVATTDEGRTPSVAGLHGHREERRRHRVEIDHEGERACRARVQDLSGTNEPTTGK